MSNDQATDQGTSPTHAKVRNRREGKSLGAYFIAVLIQTPPGKHTKIAGIYSQPHEQSHELLNTAML
jgi:hypothetical protein